MVIGKLGTWAGLLALVCLPAADAWADEVSGSYLGKVSERGHVVDVSLRQRQVVYKVQRSFYNAAKNADELEATIQLPTAAVATKLRVRMAGRWYRGTLLGRKPARKLYDTLTSSGPARRRGPALLSWNSPGELELKVFPVGGRSTVVVEYELVAPACYSDGHLIADYTGGATKSRAPSLRVRGGGTVLSSAQLQKRLGRTSLDHVCSTMGTNTSADNVRYIAFKHRRKRAVSGRMGSYRVAANSHLVSYDIDIARRLLAKPRRARVVFVVDASRSVGLANIRAQLSLIRGYIGHLRDAAYEVVLYRRFASRLFGGFVPANKALAALATIGDARLRPGNGSNLDRGMALATRLLDGQRGPHRVIAFTDSRFRSGFAAKLVGQATVGSRALVHYVDLSLSAGTFSWERDDKHDLAPIAGATGGIVASMSGTGGSSTVIAEQMLSLVRPDHLDQFQVHGLPGTPDLASPGRYASGRGFRGMFVSKRAVGSLRVTGKIWGSAVDMTLRPSDRVSRALPRLVFGHDAHTSLPKKSVAALARTGRVVSPKTSLLAWESRMRKTSFQAMTGHSMSRSYSFSSRCGGPSVGRIGRGYLRRVTRKAPPRWAGILREHLQDRIAGCDLLHSSHRHASVGVSIETTGREIVGVRVTGAGAALRSCVREAAWQLHLDERFSQKRGNYRFGYATKFGKSSCGASSSPVCTGTPSQTRERSTARR